MNVKLKPGFTRKLRDFGDKGRLYQVVNEHGDILMENDGSSVCELEVVGWGIEWEFNANLTGGFDLDCDDAELEARCHASFVERGYGASSPWEVVA